MSIITPTQPTPTTATIKRPLTAADGFAAVLQFNTATPLPRPDSLEGLAAYLASDTGAIAIQDIDTMAQNALNRVNQQLQAALNANNIKNNTPIIIEIDKTGQISISDNPEKAKILEMLNNTPELVHAIRQAVALQQRSAMIQQYDEYLKAYHKAYAEGGARAAQVVSDRYLLLSSRFTYQFDETKNVTILVNGQSIKDWLSDTARIISKN